MTSVAAVGTGAAAVGRLPTEQGDFVYDVQAMRIVFGPGRLNLLGDEVARLGWAKVLVLCTPGRRALGERLAEMIGPGAAGVFSGARTHVPVGVAVAGTAEARRVGADGCVAVGGGSAIGLGKAIALETGLPTICVPTTYSGSEMTPVWGLTADGEKTTGRDPVVLPRTVIYDPELTVDLPRATSAASGINALAHSVEALYAPDLTPVVALMAEESARSLASALPAVVDDPTNIDARSLALRGSWLAGACLGATTMALHHKLCHVLGGMFELPHAETHTVVLPHVAAFNLRAAPGAADALKRALCTDDPARALSELNRSLDNAPSLESLGLEYGDLGPAADAVLARPYRNPRPVVREAVLAILDAAWRGVLPSARAQ